MRDQILDYKNNQQKSIYGILPQRYPIILIDRIVEATDDSLHAIKCISNNEAIFEGHFPENPIYPGIYIIEGIGQAGCYLVAYNYYKKNNDFVKNVRFSSVDKVKFKQAVTPGDVMHYHVKVLKMRGDFVWIEGHIKLNESDEIAAKMEFSAYYSNK